MFAISSAMEEKNMWYYSSKYVREEIEKKSRCPSFRHFSERVCQIFSNNHIKALGEELLRG